VSAGSKVTGNHESTTAEPVYTWTDEVYRRMADRAEEWKGIGKYQRRDSTIRTWPDRDAVVLTLRISVTVYSRRQERKAS